MRVVRAMGAFALPVLCVLWMPEPSGACSVISVCDMEQTATYGELELVLLDGDDDAVAPDGLDDVATIRFSGWGDAYLLESGEIAMSLQVAEVAP